jgi:GTP-binding protein
MIDSVEITVRAGEGGRGRVMFRREAHVSKGGPWGGDGGDGGSVFLVADAELNTLQTFKHRRVFKAESGGDGGARNMHGANGADLEVKVPAGTEVWEVEGEDGKQLVADLLKPGMRALVAKGGRGGWGNARFVSPTNQEPLIAEAGEDGEVKRLKLDLKVLAEVGLIGMPNAGKSSLLAGISAAKPKIADYPFTTLEPVLGVVYTRQARARAVAKLDRFTVADIPGLIEGAHRGAGLGQEFLKHVERARVLVHVVDGSADDPAKSILVINRELAAFSPELAAKPQIIAVNKLDLPGVKERRRAISASIRRMLGAGQRSVFVSALTREGLDSLVRLTGEVLQEAVQVEKERAVTAEVAVLRPAPKQGRPNIVVEAPGVYRIVHPWAIRLAKGSKLDDWAARVQYHARLRYMSVTHDLEELGVRPGDKVLVADWEFVWE